ncbi:MAG: universal stress protein [Deltaproteobacteria bacterium]|nr:universal stress protein [Deltaproteobacteria bacterium]
MESPKRILVPTDFSKSANKAFEYALMLADQFKAELYLLHIVQEIDHYAGDYSLTKEMVKQFKKNSLDSSKAQLQEVINKYPEAKGVKIITEIKVGIPYQEILYEAEKKKADLIVIATHGKSALIHQIMGSVSERVLRGAECPIMLLRH